MSWKRRLRSLLLALGRQLGGGSTRQLGALALCHHRIDDSGRRHSLSFDAFREQMRCLADAGAQWMTVTELGAALTSKDVPPRAVCVTFDDASESAYEPIKWLLEIGGRCTQFAVVDWVSGGAPDTMSWSQLRKLSALGVEIGSHTMAHLDLRTLDAEGLRTQLEMSRTRLERELGRSVSSFAYPYGLFDKRIVRAVAASYGYACSTQHAHATSSFSPLLIPRHEVFDRETVEELFSGRGWMFYWPLQSYLLTTSRLGRC